MNTPAVTEIPPGGETRAQRLGHGELVLVLAGRGATSFTDDGGATMSFEWRAGALFVVPALTHQHFNLSGHDPVRYLAVETVAGKPIGLGDYFASALREDGARLAANFVADILNLPLRPAPDRGPGHGGLGIDVGDAEARISQIPPGQAETDPFAGRADIVAVLGGSGHSLLGAEDGSSRRKDWEAGVAFSVAGYPTVLHMSSGARPARLLTLRSAVAMSSS